MLLTNGVLMDHANYFEQFSIDYCYVEIFALARSVSLFCVMGMRNWHLNT